MTTSTFPKTRAITNKINDLIRQSNYGLIKPYPASKERRDLVVEGLSILAQECGTLAKGEPVGSAVGNDISFQCQKVDSNFDYTFGEKLAELLNTVPVHHNLPPQKGFVCEYNSQVYLAQHRAEQLLFNAANIEEQIAATA
jgi:hypothetical protein